MIRRLLLIPLVVAAGFVLGIAPHLILHPTGRGSRVSAVRVQISSFLAALAAYREDTGSFPTSQQGLDALYSRPPGVKNWQGPYLESRIPLDPWGHSYVYRFPGTRGEWPDIICYGADGQAGGTGINADTLSLAP